MEFGFDVILFSYVVMQKNSTAHAENEKYFRVEVALS